MHKKVKVKNKEKRVLELIEEKYKKLVELGIDPKACYHCEKKK